MKDLNSQVLLNEVETQKVILPPQETFVAGCLPAFQQKWNEITEDPVTLDAVVGFTIPFDPLPPCRLPTHEELTAADSDVVVDESIKEILELKAAIVVPPDSPGFYSRVFTVPKMERGVEYGKRFIINLKVSCFYILDNDFKVPVVFNRTDLILGLKEFRYNWPTLSPVGDIYWSHFILVDL